MGVFYISIPNLQRLLIKPFEFLYTGILASLHVLALPLVGLFSLKSKYKNSLKARFLARKHALNSPPILWFHACSFGEIKSLQALLDQFPQVPILLTTTTQTGFDLACATYAKSPHIQVRFLLFETLLFLWRKDLAHLKALVVTEAELWLNVFRLAKSVGAQTFLINARISERSYPRYQRFKGFYAHLFKQVDRIYAQTPLDQERLATLGAQNVQIFPNLKLFNPPKVSHTYAKPDYLIVLAASTHPSEEELILKAFLALNDLHARLLIAPRHPERFTEVKALLENQGIVFNSLSKGFDLSKSVFVIDKLGVLNDFYPLADVVILGGSFVPVGGHNPLEPAFFGVKLISGKHIFNQEALFACVQNYALIEPEQLGSTLANHAQLLPSFLDTHNHEISQLAHAIYPTSL